MCVQHEELIRLLRGARHITQFYTDVELDDDADVGYVRHVVAKRKQLVLEYCRKAARHG